MASFNHHHAPGAAAHPASYGAPVPVPTTNAPMGTFAPGTKIQVGSHRVVIQKYLSEGGFAHVYLVKLPKPVDGTDVAVLKRVAVPDKDALANMRTEVETMKKLKGHRPIVTYFDSHASSLKGGGYEVFLLMEYCNGGGLIDFMNTRLQNRLTEPEILKIFTDVSEGVACMHYLRPPLLHRDLKVENVLITTTGHSKRFKLCDFGSTAPPRPAATTVADCRLIEDDIQKHTTLQYRSPEMIDVYRKQPIDEKSDIWALGVLLYKLCYYTTPFEEQGQLAILNASFSFPAYPPFSDPLKRLIASMLKENPRSRPNIYQVLREVCLMQGREVPIKDIYSTRSQSEVRKNQELPPTPDQTANAKSPPVVGAVFQPPAKQQQVIPDVVPMRRGRLPASQAPTQKPDVSSPKPDTSSKPSVSPMRGTSSDPFAALDNKNAAASPGDEISARFPSLDQFSLLHDHGHKFEFDSNPTATSKPKDLNQRVTEKLADDAFAAPTTQPRGSPPKSGSRASRIIANTPELQDAISSPELIHQPTPQKPKPSMVSQGTMTSPSPPPSDFASPKMNAPQIYRFPPTSSHPRSSSMPRGDDNGLFKTQSARTDSLPRPTPSPRLASFQKPSLHARQPSSSRPSLEGGRPSNSDLSEPIPRTRSANTRSRPSSTYLESDMAFLRDREGSGRSSNTFPPITSNTRDSVVLDEPEADETNISSNVDFLKSMEGDGGKKKGRRSSSETKSKRSSLPSLSGTKNLLAGKFGDAFKRFEGGGGPRTPSPHSTERRDLTLTPIAGSEATDGRSDDGQVLEETDNMPAEQRRELERRRLSAEEKRVAQAAAEYRQRLADREAGGGGAKSATGMTRAKTIQSKVQSLLDETSRPPPPKTAEGYGRYTTTSSQAQAFEQPPAVNPYPKAQVQVPRKPVALASNTAAPNPNPKPPVAPLNYPKPRTGVPVNASNPVPMSTASAPPALAQRPAATAGRPSAPPKPVHLNSLTTGGSTQSQSQTAARGTVDPLSPSRDDYIADFSKRFPSLSGIEMVETSIGKEPAGMVRTKEA